MVAFSWQVFYKLKAYVKQKNLMKYLDGGKADEESNKEDIGATSDEG